MFGLKALEIRLRQFAIAQAELIRTEMQPLREHVDLLMRSGGSLHETVSKGLAEHQKAIDEIRATFAERLTAHILETSEELRALEARLDKLVSEKEFAHEVIVHNFKELDARIDAEGRFDEMRARLSDELRSFADELKALEARIDAKLAPIQQFYLGGYAPRPLSEYDDGSFANSIDEPHRPLSGDAHDEASVVAEWQEPAAPTTGEAGQ